MIGYSVSFCVRDIAQGKVAIADVEKVVGGVRCQTEEEWDEVIAQYCKVYWADDPAGCVGVLNELRKQGKIDQPRLRGENAPNIADGYWAEQGV